MICLCFLPDILGVLKISEELMHEDSAYIGIVIAGLLATTCYNICAVVLRAIGDSYTPLIFLVISNLLNVGLDYLFILYLHMGVSGAAAATVIAQAISALICFLYMRIKYKQFILHVKDIIPN